MERNFSSSFNKELQKDIARRALSTKPNDIRQTIEDEIDSGSGVVQPVVAVEHRSEKKGDGNPNNNSGDSFKTKDDIEKEETQKLKKDE